MNKLISFLGTGRYQPCFYYHKDEKATKSRFVQTAIYELLSKQGIHIDEVNILLTEKAEKTNWKGFEHEGEYLIGLKDMWDETFPEKNKLVPVPIPDNQTEDGQWELFNIIYDLIGEGDTVFFDITHSFRSYPLMALLILNFSRLMKNAELGGLFYGNFEASRPVESENDKQESLRPIVDMTDILSLFDWTNGVDTYLRTGNPEILNDLAERGMKNGDSSVLPFKKLSEKLLKVNQVIQTCRGLEIDKSVNKAIECMEEVKGELSHGNRPFSKLIDKIEEKLNVFHKDFPLSIPGMVEWCVRHGLYQQAYTIMEEGVISTACLIFGLQQTDRDQRMLANSALKLYIGRKAESEWKVDDKEKVKELMERLDPYGKYLIPWYPDVHEKRNNINHNAMNNHQMRVGRLIDTITESVSKSRPFFQAVYRDYVKDGGERSK